MALENTTTTADRAEEVLGMWREANRPVPPCVSDLSPQNLEALAIEFQSAATYARQTILADFYDALKSRADALLTLAEAKRAIAEIKEAKS